MVLGRYFVWISEKFWVKYNYHNSGHYPSSCFFYLKHNVSEAALCLRLQVGPTKLGPIVIVSVSGDRVGSTWRQAKSSLQRVLF
jgi:hypothetical protein